MPKPADITYQGNEFVLTGELDYGNVMSLFQKSLADINACPELIFNFGQVKSCNSAAIALIMEWIKLGKHCGKQVKFKSLSQELVSIAHVSGLDNLICNS